MNDRKIKRSIKRRKRQATRILKRMYKEFRRSITAEQWKEILTQVRRARIKADGVVLEGKDLEEAAKATVLERIAYHATKKGKK